jgi:hypothetical protein
MSNILQAKQDLNPCPSPSPLLGHSVSSCSNTGPIQELFFNNSIEHPHSRQACTGTKHYMPSKRNVQKILKITRTVFENFLEKFEENLIFVLEKRGNKRILITHTNE